MLENNYKNIKVGDKLIFKKHLINLYRLYHVNKKYEILEIYSTSSCPCVIKVSTNDNGEFIFTLDYKNKYGYDLWDYFYTPDELRKLKLNIILK